MDMKLKTVTETVNTHELEVGDWVSDHCCIFKLTSKTVHTSPDNLKYDPKGTVSCKTFRVAYSPDGGLPESWSHDWTIQGNSRATWQRITNKAELIKQIKAAMKAEDAA